MSSSHVCHVELTCHVSSSHCCLVLMTHYLSSSHGLLVKPIQLLFICPVYQSISLVRYSLILSPFVRTALRETYSSSTSLSLIYVPFSTFTFVFGILSTARTEKWSAIVFPSSKGGWLLSLKFKKRCFFANHKIAEKKIQKIPWF